jgi:glycosyltransferase involved in cell wall biosynthesis
LAPYQRHVGMSGILLLAAAAGKPVLSSDYGLMGELVRRYGLGITVDSTVPSEIAKGLMRCLTEPATVLVDLDRMESFAEQHSAERYAKTIFEQLGNLGEKKPNS